MKRLFADIESTGTDPSKHGIVQIACTVEIDGKVVDEFQSAVQPFLEDEISDEALRISGVTRQDLAAFPAPQAVHANLKDLFGGYVDQYARSDKMHFVAYNAKFDDDFLRAFWRKCRDKYYGSWFFWPPLDVAGIAAWVLMEKRAQLQNFKLETVARHLGVKVDSEKTHDAMYDVEIMRALFRKLLERRS